MHISYPDPKAKTATSKVGVAEKLLLVLKKQEKPNPAHRKAFNQLLDDAVLGVKKR